MGREIKWKQPRALWARFNLIVAPPSHCQKRTHLGFRGDTALRGQLKMPRHLFCRRFYFVSEKERKVKLWLATPGAPCFFAPPLVGSLGDRGPKQAARQLVGKRQRGSWREGGGQFCLTLTHHCCQPKVSLCWPTKMSRTLIFSTFTCSKLNFQEPPSLSLVLLPKKECRKIKRPNRGEVNSISLNTRLYG